LWVLESVAVFDDLCIGRVDGEGFKLQAVTSIVNPEQQEIT